MTSSKFKLLLYLLFAVIAVVFVSHVWNLINSGFNEINHQKKGFNCNNLNFQIVDKKFGIKNISLVLISDSLNFNIITAKIMSDIENNDKLYEFDPVFLPGQSRELFIKDIYIENSINLIVENCVENGVEIKR